MAKARYFSICGVYLTWNQLLMIVTCLMIGLTLVQLVYQKNAAGQKQKFEFVDRRVYREKRLVSTLEEFLVKKEPTSKIWTQGGALLDQTSVASRTMSSRCASLHAWDRLRDFECHAEWINHLRYAKIVDIDMMLGFEKGKRNAFRVVFEDGSYGWYKTCPGQGENPDMEIVGYFIDHFLQFHTMSPAVSRLLNVKELERVVKNGDPSFKTLLAQTDYICGAGENFTGVMIGWWDNLEETSSPIKKKSAEESEVLLVRQQWDEIIANNSYPIQDMPRNHALLFLLSILQHQGHNEFRIQNGPLVSVDVDRAQFSTSPKKSLDFGLSFLCKMDLETYSILKEIHSNYEPDQFGYIILKAVEHFAPTVKFTRSEAIVLQERVIFLLDSLQECIQTFGYENVIYDKEF